LKPLVPSDLFRGARAWLGLEPRMVNFGEHFDIIQYQGKLSDKKRTLPAGALNS